MILKKAECSIQCTSFKKYKVLYLNKDDNIASVSKAQKILDGYTLYN